MNALTQYLKGAQDLALTDAQMADALAETRDEATSGAGGGVTYLNFSGKTGRYSLGKDKEDVDPSEPYILEPRSLFTGWQCWKGNKPIDKHKWSIYNHAAKIEETDLADHGPYRETHGEGWKRMLGFGVVSEAGVMIEFSSDSVSGRNAVGDLIDEIRQRMVAGENSVPLVMFDREQFLAQEKTNFKPKFVVDVWVSREQVEAYMHPDVAYTFEDLRGGKKVSPAQQKKLQAA